MIHRCLDISAHVTTRPSSRQLGSDFETTRPMCRDRSAPGLKQLGPGVEIYSNALMIAYVERCIIIMYVYIIIYILLLSIARQWHQNIILASVFL